MIYEPPPLRDIGRWSGMDTSTRLSGTGPERAGTSDTERPLPGGVILAVPMSTRERYILVAAITVMIIQGVWNIYVVERRDKSITRPFY